MSDKQILLSNGLIFNKGNCETVIRLGLEAEKRNRLLQKKIDVLKEALEWVIDEWEACDGVEPYETHEVAREALEKLKELDKGMDK